jgi:hypothetical protein
MICLNYLIFTRNPSLWFFDYIRTLILNSFYYLLSLNQKKKKKNYKFFLIKILLKFKIFKKKFNLLIK